jgi:ABC-type transport system involved in multi-copper enzyme maturation permease subunit
MQMAAALNLLQYLSPLRLTGPLSDKELRVASRRYRNYALRAGYILLLSLLMLSAWYSRAALLRMGSVAVSVSRAADMALYVTARIAWFQFVTAQLVAAIMLSSSISEEMRRGTLSTLLTTPMSSEQIVIGKLFAGLLQVLVLLALSLPALAILRIQGGVEWGFVVSASCITLSAVVFGGALSLWLSTYYHHPYRAVSAGAVVYFVVFLVLPAIVTALASAGLFNLAATSHVLDLANPFRALHRMTPQIAVLGGAPRPPFPWPLHCLVLCSWTAVILCATVHRVRRAAIEDRSGRIETKFRPIHRLRGSPIAWKENLLTAFQWRWANIAIAATAVALCGLALWVDVQRMRSLYVHLGYIASGLWMLALLRLSVAVAGGITREKESGAWAVLLMTPLDDEQIVRAKAWAALRRNAVLLLSAFAMQMCLMLSTVGRHRLLPGVYFASHFLVGVVFIVGAGSYFGVRLKTTTGAAAVTFGAHLCLTYIMGGLINTVVLRLFWPASARGPTTLTTVLRFSISIGTIVLTLLLGRYLLRRACRTARQYVF